MQETTLEVLAAANPADFERWSSLVLNSPTPDVYYLPEYARATAEIEQTEPLAIVTGSDSSGFLAPLLVRRMSAAVDGSRIDWIDASSPYGYGGLLPLSSCQPAKDYNVSAFIDTLKDWCSANNAVCCALRLHPVMRQEEWFAPDEHAQRFFRLQLRGSTTAMDLQNWDDAGACPHGMRKHRRYDLNFAGRVLRVTWAGGDDPDVELSLGRFFNVYEQAMESRHADSFYRFSRSYFSGLASLGHRLGIAFAWMDNELAGASIFLAGRDCAHYHLACGNKLGMKLKAATLLIVEGARWARTQGCQVLHLGGGLHPGDSLEHFKFSFGGALYRYAYAVCIADEERFEQLCRLPNAPWPYRANNT